MLRPSCKNNLARLLMLAALTVILFIRLNAIEVIDWSGDPSGCCENISSFNAHGGWWLVTAVGLC